jgi:predicted dithiol-disulfide oxidoreductase (DUF899 family)
MHPTAVSRDEWVTARKELLAKEKEFSRARDALSAARRTLPGVVLREDYRFEGPEGQVSLEDLFEGRSQLVVYHFMLGPDWDEGCPMCSFVVDNLPDLSHLREARDTSLVLVSRAPLEKILPFRERMGWTVPWYSSFGSSFNYDFHVTIDRDVVPVEYNYRNREELERQDPSWRGWSGEQPGVSVFFRQDGEILHTYSSYARGLDLLLGTYNYLDLTPLGRQEDGPGSHEFRHHDRY